MDNTLLRKTRGIAFFRILNGYVAEESCHSYSKL